MININDIVDFAKKYNIPLEDALFIALNINGVNLRCDYNRMRMAFHLSDDEIFSYAKNRGEQDYYFALPVNLNSPFAVIEDNLFLQDFQIGKTIGLTEDICDSHYPRRNGTSLNINPNSRTSCRGCEFCYTAYQISCDRKKLKNETDLRDFFDNWMLQNSLLDLSHLIQVSIVTGCYENSDELCNFLHVLKDILLKYNFTGKIFYFGSQIISEKHLTSLADIKPFGICFSLETFERREILHNKKKAIGLTDICESMNIAKGLGYEVNFSYIVGIEPLCVMEKYFNHFKNYINKFPTINTLQIHKYHKESLRTKGAEDLEYYLQARSVLERIFKKTKMRPLVWEDYRSLWFLTFNGELLEGTRTP